MINKRKHITPKWTSANGTAGSMRGAAQIENKSTFGQLGQLYYSTYLL